MEGKRQDYYTAGKRGKKKDKVSTKQIQKYYDKKQRLHNIKKGDWVRVNKREFPSRYFTNDRKRTINSKYSVPAKVLKVKNGSATLEANQDFLKDT
jgi:hypothetical protein